MAFVYSKNLFKFKSIYIKNNLLICILQILGTFKDHFCKIAIDAVKCLEGTKKVRNINIVKKTGSSIESSTFINGILLNKKVCLGCPNRVENARILITRMDLDSFRTKIWGTTIKVESHEQGKLY